MRQFPFPVSDVAAHLRVTNDWVDIVELQGRHQSARAGSTVVEAKGSHSIYVSQPAAVADLIEQAASG